MDSLVLAAALTGQVTEWLDNYGAFLFYLIVWGLVFAGTGLLIGAFIPFITGDSLIFAAGVLAATSDSINIWVLFQSLMFQRQSLSVHHLLRDWFLQS